MQQYFGILKCVLNGGIHCDTATTPAHCKLQSLTAITSKTCCLLKCQTGMWVTEHLISRFLFAPSMAVDHNNRFLFLGRRHGHRQTQPLHGKPRWHWMAKGKRPTEVRLGRPSYTAASFWRNFVPNGYVFCWDLAHHHHHHHHHQQQQQQEQQQQPQQQQQQQQPQPQPQPQQESSTPLQIGNGWNNLATEVLDNRIFPE